MLLISIFWFLWKSERSEATAPVGEGKDIRCNVGPPNILATTTWELVVFYAIRAIRHPKRENKFHIKIASNDVTMCVLLLLSCVILFAAHIPWKMRRFHNVSTNHISGSLHIQRRWRIVQHCALFNEFLQLHGNSAGFSPSMPFTRPTTKWFPLFRDHYPPRCYYLTYPMFGKPEASSFFG